jgi:class III poly(R)-hydroxyalkanoic acid synthase PhaE subunit
MMASKSKDNEGFEFIVSEWMKTGLELWQPFVSMWGGFGGKVDASAAGKDKHQSRLQETVDTSRKTWESISSMMIEPETIESLFKGGSAVPAILMNLAQTSWTGFMHLQQKWLENVGKIGESAGSYSFENLDEDALKVWHELYEKEFRKYFNIPQLGLARLYQEKILKASDKHNLLQVSVAEFFHLLYLPVEKSLKAMQLRLAELADHGELPEDPKTYYQMWVKVLEGHYMTLFQSEEYGQVLRKTLKSISEFSQAKKDVLQDTLNMLPVPTQKEMDELYKEIYLLKRKIKTLEKSSS